jgi:hypothetical protein
MGCSRLLGGGSYRAWPRSNWVTGGEGARKIVSLRIAQAIDPVDETGSIESLCKRASGSHKTLQKVPLSGTT